MSVHDPLRELADLIREKNIVDGRITDITNRPTQRGHVGEYIAAQIFGITLHGKANRAGSDGHFGSGPLQGRTVNVKWYAKQKWMLDIKLNSLPDYFLVFTGPTASAETSRGQVHPWVIEHVYLFEASALIEDLVTHEVQIKKDAPTHVRTKLWSQAEIYPMQTNTILMIPEERRCQLQFFLVHSDADKN